MKIHSASVVECDGSYRATVKLTSDLMSAEESATASDPEGAVKFAFNVALESLAKKVRASLTVEYAVKF